MSDRKRVVLDRPKTTASLSVAAGNLWASIEGVLSSGRLAQAGLLVLALLGVVILRISAAHGPGVGGDATIYITSAQNLLAGKGLGLALPGGGFRLLPYFPPLFPLVLSAAGLLGLDLVQAALWLNLLLFGGLIWLTGAVVFNVTRSGVFALLAASLVLLSPVLIPVYSWAMSEPLAIFLSFAGLALLLGYLRAPGARGLLAAAALLVGLGILARYAQAAFLLAGGLGLFLLARGPWRSRLADAALYGLVGSLPAVAWVIYDLAQTATLSSRSLETAAGRLQRLANLWPALKDVFLFWFIPESWVLQPPYPAGANAVLLFVALAGLVVAFILALRGSARPGASAEQADGRRLAWLLALSGLAYLLTIAVVYITTYPPITIASRMLSPLHVVFLWLVALLAGLGAHRVRETRRPAGLLALGLVLLLAWYGWRSLRIVQQNAQLGLGFNAVAWQESETIRALEALPAGETIITNEEMAVLYLTGRVSYPLAEIYFDRPLEQFSVYGQGSLPGDPAQRLFYEDQASLVLFDTLSDQIEALYGERTEERARRLTEGLQAVFRGADGAIYVNPNPGP